MAIELFEHNQETYESIKAMMEGGDRVAVVQPTGTGKSFLFLKWIEENPDDVFVVVSPSNEIFNQLERYAQGAGDGDILSNTEFISYQTLNNMTDKEMSGVVVDKLILDEYHRAGATQWGPSLQRFFDLHPEIEVLGATATPIRYLDDCKNMTEILFGGEFARYMTLGEAIAKRILPTPTYVQVWNEDDERVRDYQEQIDSIPDTKSHEAAVGFFSSWMRHLEMAYGPEKMFKKYMGSDHGKFIVFCSDVEHLELMKYKMVLWLKDVNENVRSYVSIAQRADKDIQLKDFIMDRDEDAVRLLFSIDRFNEGLHVSGLDGVIMLRPTTSPIIYLQQIGRALSAGASKKPLVFDMVNNYKNCEFALESGVKLNVLEAEINDYLTSNLNKVDDLSEEVSSFNIFSQSIEFAEVFEEIEKVLYPDFDAIWDGNYARVEDFKREHGRLPDWGDKHGNFFAGRWLSNEIGKALKPGYPQGRYIKLAALGVFSVVRKGDFYSKVSLTLEFKQVYGRLPKGSDLPYKNVKLGNFVRDQRTAARKNKLSPERRAVLEEAGILVVSTDPEWEFVRQVYESFYSEFDRHPMESDPPYGGLDLYKWRKKQLQQANSDTYPPEQLKKLKSMGFFESNRDKVWNENYLAFKRYVAKYNSLPPKRAKHGKYCVGTWFVRQMGLINNPDYPQERRVKLLKIPLISQRLFPQGNEKQ